MALVCMSCALHKVNTVSSWAVMGSNVVCRMLYLSLSYSMGMFTGLAETK